MPVSGALTAPSPPSRTRRGHTSERILDAAEELFAERGYAGTTLRHVAERVGIRTPSLYNHFSSKESLYAAVIERGLGPVLRALAEFPEAGGGAEEESVQLIRRVMKLLARRPALPRLILHETLSGGQRLTPMLESWIAPAFARAHEMIEASPGARRWEPDQIPLLVLAMVQIVLGTFTLAPLYGEVTGKNPTTGSALDRQTRFLADLAASLFAELPAGPRVRRSSKE